MDFLPQRLIVLFVVITAVNSIRFYVSPSPFYEEDEDVKVICNLYDETINGIESVQNMNIQEFVNGSWLDVANINYDELIDNNMVDMSIDGYVGRPTESYLMLTWYKASPYFYGRYRCAGTALDNKNEFRVLKSVELDIKGLARSNFNLFDLLRDNHKQEMKHIDEIVARTYQLESNENEKFQNASMNGIQLRQSMDNLQEILKDNVMKNLFNLSRQLARIETVLNKTNNSP